MRKMMTKAALAATSLIGLSTAANAYVVLEIQEIGGAPTTICNANVAGCTGAFTIINSNLVSFTSTVGNFQVNGTFGTSNSPGTANAATVDISTLRVERIGSGGSGQLFVGVKAFNFSDPNGEFKTLSGSAGGSSQQFGTGTGTVSSNFWADSTNAGLASNLISCTYNITSNGSCAAPSIVWNDPAGSGAGLFSLRAEQLFTMQVGTSINQTLALTANRIPEPMTASLVGVALLGLALASKRKAKTA